MKYFNVGCVTHKRNRELEHIVFKAESKEQFLEHCKTLGVVVEEYAELELVDITKGAIDG